MTTRTQRAADPATAGTGRGSADAASPGRPGLRSRILAALVILGFPALALATTRWTLRMTVAPDRAGNLDQFTYLGYLNRYGELVERFGQQYHANRVSYLWVDTAFFRLLGAEAGYFAARYVALVAATAAVYALARRFADDRVAVVAAAFVCFVPWLRAQLLWTHYDGFATVYLLGAVALLFAPRRRRTVAEIGAGALFALAVNAHLLLLAVGGLAALPWWFLNRGDGLGRQALATVRVVAGFVGMYAVLGAIMYARYPEWGFFERYTIQVARDVVGDDTWFTPISSFGWSRAYLLAVAAIGLVVVGRAVALRVRGRWDATNDLLVAASLWLGAIIVLSLYLHFALQSTWLGTDFYAIYFLPPVVLALIAVLGEATRRLPSRQATAISVAVVGVFLVVHVVGEPGPSLARLVQLASMAAIIVVAGAVVGSGRRAAAITAVAAALLALPFMLSGHAESRGVFSSLAERNAFEWDVFRHAMATQELVEEHVATDQMIRFWHRNDPDRRDWLWNVNMVYYGHGDQRLHANRSLGMPYVDDRPQNILSEQPTALALVGDSTAEVDAGIDALRDAGFPVDVIVRDHLDGTVVDLSVAIVSVTPPE